MNYLDDLIEKLIDDLTEERKNPAKKREALITSKRIDSPERQNCVLVNAQCGRTQEGHPHS